MSSLITNLGIDWKLLLAQGINFALLVYILRRFVYGPIIAVLEKRRQDIADTQSKSAQADLRLEEIESEKQKVLTEARNQAKEIISKAQVSAKRQTEESLTEAIRKAEMVMTEGKSSLERERSKIKSEIKSEIGEVVAAAVEKTVGDFLSKEAEDKLKAEALAIIRERAETFK